jgi:hypothetical protein
LVTISFSSAAAIIVMCVQQPIDKHLIAEKAIPAVFIFEGINAILTLLNRLFIEIRLFFRKPII